MSLLDIESAFARARDLNVLLVGEAITDEYVYVSPLCKPSKELVLATAEEGVEVFAGGIDAAAAHLDGNFAGSRSDVRNPPLTRTPETG